MRRLEPAQRVAIFDDGEELKGPPFAHDMVAVALEDFDLGARGYFDRDDAGLGRIAEQQAIAVELRRYFLPATHWSIVPISILERGSATEAQSEKFAVPADATDAVHSRVERMESL